MQWWNWQHSSIFRWGRIEMSHKRSKLTWECFPCKYFCNQYKIKISNTPLSTYCFYVLINMLWEQDNNKVSREKKYIFLLVHSLCQHRWAWMTALVHSLQLQNVAYKTHSVVSPPLLSFSLLLFCGPCMTTQNESLKVDAVAFSPGTLSSRLEAKRKTPNQAYLRHENHCRYTIHKPLTLKIWKCWFLMSPIWPNSCPPLKPFPISH